MPRRPTLIALAVALVGAALVGAAPALAITGGSPDTVHTNVGLVRFTTTAGRFRCSGTLISPTVVLTAGHCTEGPATNVYVSFDDALQPDPLQPGISPAERAAREAHYITGTAHPDPGWDGKLSLAKQHDQGVVVLSAPATTKWPAITPAPLPPVGFLDRNQGQLKNETFTLVGYGVDIGDKKAQIVVQERRFTTSYLKNVQDEVVVFQINDNDSKAGGGSCFGDSGGAVFLDGYVLGDASYVNSLTCNATGSYQRADTPYSRAFLNQFLIPSTPPAARGRAPVGAVPCRSTGASARVDNLPDVPRSRRTGTSSAPSPLTTAAWLSPCSCGVPPSRAWPWSMSGGPRPDRCPDPRRPPPSAASRAWAGPSTAGCSSSQENRRLAV